MSKKHTYRSVDVQRLVLAQVLEQLVALVVVIAVDVAKRRQVAALSDGQGRPAFLCHWEHPTQTPGFLELVEGLVAAGKQVQVVMEPTGTYGDALAYACHQRQCQVYRLSPKKTHDAKELFDGVPSQHDAKDATVIARLHGQGLSRRWDKPSDEVRTLRALVSQREMYGRQVEQMHGQLEALVSRHFPEFEAHMDLRKQHSALTVLRDYGGPQRMAQDEAGVQAHLQSHSRGRLSQDKMRGLLLAARHSQGVGMLAAEQELIEQVARELLRQREQMEALRGPMEAELKQMPQAQGLLKLLGVSTTAVLMSHLGDLRSYNSPKALEKACGLNLTESSSGRDQLKKYKPGVHVSKRGPGIVRKYLYLATLRWLQGDCVARAWYERRRGYTEGSKQRAVVALMRKLVALLFHLSRGASYEPSRLFDLRRLTIGSRGDKSSEQAHDAASRVKEVHAQVN